MKRCDKHRKDHIGGCVWCGKRVCDFCVLKRDRSKLYCEKCTPVVGTLGKTALPIERRHFPASGRRFVLQNGQLVLEGGD